MFDAVRSRNSPTYADYRKKIELERQFINKARILIDQTKSSDSIVKLVMDIEMSEQLYQVEKKQDALETAKPSETNQADYNIEDQLQTAGHNRTKGVANNRRSLGQIAINLQKIEEHHDESKSRLETKMSHEDLNIFHNGGAHSSKSSRDSLVVETTVFNKDMN